jgi:Cu(I)/Ag(I) efflux system membrane fusion protein
VQVDVYEPDVPFVKPDQTAKLTVEGRDEPIEARASFLSPTIDETTRTLKARFSVDNGDGALRPGAFVSAELEIPLGRGLVVPDSAVIHTGRRAIVFVVHGNHAEPREVKLGSVVEGKVRVERGLAVGEQVATGAQFLLDSESRMRATSATGAGHAH